MVLKIGINIKLTNDVVITVRNRSCGGTLLGRAKPAASKICIGLSDFKSLKFKSCLSRDIKRPYLKYRGRIYADSCTRRIYFREYLRMGGIITLAGE